LVTASASTGQQELHILGEDSGTGVIFRSPRNITLDTAENFHPD
jgi:hypothetical protein